MKRISVFFVMPCLFLAVTLEGNVAIQNNWQDGPGIGGPVENLGSAFYESAGINYLYEANRLTLSIALSGEPEIHHVWDNHSQLDKKIEIANLGTGEDTSDVIDRSADVVISSAEGITWFPNDGEGNFEYTRQICPAASEYTGYDLADFNGDGFTDVVVGDYGSGQISLYLNNDKGFFTFHTTVGYLKGVHQLAAADFDSDGNVDVVATHHHIAPIPTGPEMWFQNDGSSNHFTPHYIGNVGHAARRINHADLDADGDIDFITSELRGTYWMENKISEIGPDNGFVIHALDTTRKNLYDWIADIDKDGKNDVVVTNVDDSITYPQWWENDLPEGFIMHRLFTPESRNPEGVVAIDIDFDGDIDIIQSYFGPTYPDTNGKAGWIGWFENQGKEHFHYHRFANYPQSCDLQVGDMDGNGLLDLVTSTHFPGRSTDWWDLFDRFESEGRLTSSIFDAGEPSSWNGIVWSADTSELKKTRVSFQVRASNDPLNWPDWAQCGTITKPSSLASLVDQETRYMQYRVTLTSGNTAYSPMLYEVRIEYGSTSVKEGEEGDVAEAAPRLEVSNGTIRYYLARGVRARLYVFDVSGRRLETFEVVGEGGKVGKEGEEGEEDEEGEEGLGVMNIGAFGRGVYFVRLEAGHSNLVRKVVTLR